ncbi:SusF/SusE family outer membrane protein [Bacteroides mediterraneensis]|uniref:SusF/SusE family outer membrane protein n=1 Tax=Bacteroides mediterraneensis TaxID=1841856 RepID=A0ABS2ERA7_9BACE|nr:SusF/SusE family outer membrane protein [Bacteroides mediterraneensis]MBM6757210.1 SusF/SusE family outer membrane protein [Bacteroides mediterraneensis]MBM6781373.1 SusF/SusE family outer membrane protein [Bacteroides mediterraneensis]
MKKILFPILLLVGCGLPLLTACNTDRDDNPTLQEAETFVLETPEDNVYDLGEAQDTIVLNCVQPAYGFTAATTYSVQVSLNESFVDATEEAEANYKTLSTTYTSTSIALKSTELNTAVVDLWKQANPEADAYIGTVTSVYFRLTAVITGSELGSSVSNVVKVSQVKLGEVVSTLEPPEAMYLVGSSIGTAWGTWQPMVSVNGLSGEFWSMVYFDAGAEFKFGKFEQDWNGYSNIHQFEDHAGAGLSDNGGNIKVDKAGWYIVYLVAAVNGEEYQYTMSFYEPNVYVFGNTVGDWNYNEAYKFSVPEDKSGSFVSPALTAAGEVRMCIKANTDWWRLEFTLKDGETIFYRENNAVNNGWTDLGAEYSLTANPGQKISLNFADGTGTLD